MVCKSTWTRIIGYLVPVWNLLVSHLRYLNGMFALMKLFDLNKGGHRYPFCETDLSQLFHLLTTKAKFAHDTPGYFVMA